jgi:peptidyl-prolyl cis-trans isomerase A (cyclophilin A)
MTGDYSGGKLSKDYVIFGKIVSGMDVVEKIAETSVEDNGSGEVSKPTEKVTIENVKIEESE